MDNLAQYNMVFKDSFGVSEDQLDETLVYQSVASWDSVGHMQFVAALEDAFDIMMDMDDVIDFSSYEVGKTILGKYDITF